MRAILFLALLSWASPLRAADPPKDLPANVTFSEHIAGLVFDNCTGCHRAGQVAPFTLLNYAETRKHAKTMARVMADRLMPPWQPEPGHGEFRNERRLSEYQIALFEKWVAAGMPEGDPAKTPPLPKFTEGWRLGTPDLTVEMKRPFAVPAAGPDIYQNFVIPLNLTEDKWVTAVEFRASAPTVVHHVLYHLDNSGRAGKLAEAAKDGQPGFAGMGFRPTGSLGGWAVGATPLKLPGGLAYPLRKGSDLVLQTHFHPSGKAESEVLTVGLYFAKEQPKRPIVPFQLPPAFGLMSNIDIPPGKADFKVADSFVLPVDVDVAAAGGHAHYLAKTLRTTATLPDKSEKKMFFIKDWDFNWQGQYLYKEFVRLPKGTVLRGEVTWDNSAANPRNPSSPPVRIRWGEGSTDEMGSVSLILVPDNATDEATLRTAMRDHAFEVYLKSRRRGDKIDWDALGGDPFQKALDALKKPKDGPKKNPPLSLRDLNGEPRTPLTVTGAKAHVLFFTTTDCPIANGYVPEINAIAKEFAARSVECFAVHVDPDLTASDARKHATEYALTMPVLLDTKHDLVRATGVTHTPEVAVILPDGTVAYRGRIDDRHPALGKRRAATQHDLRDALTAILAGEKPKAATTPAVGCSIPDLPQPSAAVTPLRRAHAHNDYEHKRPLLDALDQGFRSVEADIWFTKDGLLVAHTPLDLKPGRTLQSLYLDPLRERAKANGGRVYKDGPPFFLLVDVKTDAAKTFAALNEVLAGYADILTTTRDGKTEQKAVTIVVSGNCDRAAITKQAVRYAAIDGRPPDLEADTPVELVPWVSTRWGAEFKWDGTGPMPAAEKARLNAFVAATHKRGRMVRFWASPEKPEVWKELMAADVDLINTDKLAELRTFLLKEDGRR